MEKYHKQDVAPIEKENERDENYEAANPKKPHTCISNHRGDFDIDEETLPLGAALYAAYALSVLDPQFAK